MQHPMWKKNFQKNNQHAPAREPPIDEETHKAMLSYYHKKQEQQKVFFMKTIFFL